MDFQAQEIADLKKENKTLTSRCDEQAVTIQMLNLNVESVESRLDELNQYQRKHNLEIHGIPEKADEDLESVVEEVAKVLGVEDEVNSSDIDIVHRLYSKLSPRPIIVRFKNYHAKKTMYESRWKLKRYQGNNENLNDAMRIFINENLTRQRRSLFAEVRKRERMNKWYSAWTIDGKILVKTSKEEKAFRINQQSDLEELY